MNRHAHAIKIALPRPRRYLVIGVNPALVTFVETLVSRGVSPEVITVVLDGQHTPPEVSRLDGVKVSKVPKAAERHLARFVSDSSANLCCVFGWYSVFTRGLVEGFGGPMFNLHSGELPLYRGAGGYSWQVLNGVSSIGAYIHLLTPRVDAGPVICSETVEVENPAPYPIDFTLSAGVAAEKVVTQFAKDLTSADHVYGAIQDELVAEYYPKLSTLRNGVIDFSWSVMDVDRFVRAFSNPHPGATFSYRGCDFRVTRSSVAKRAISRHPFCSGLITNRSGHGLHVLLHDGVILFDEIADSNGARVDVNFFRIGDRLYTEPHARMDALTFRPSTPEA